MAPVPSGGLLGVFAALYFLYMSVTPLTKKWGPGPQSALIFLKHLILYQNEALAAPDDPLVEQIFWNVFII